MDFDISKIQNETLRNLALEADKKIGDSEGNGNGKIDTETEISIFKNSVKNANLENDSEYKSLMGLEVKASNPQTSGTVNKTVAKSVLREVKELAKSGADKDGIIDALSTKYAQRNNGEIVKDENGNVVVSPAYKQAVEEVAAVLDKVNLDNVTSKKEVKGVKKAALAALPNASKFQKDFINDSLEDMAEEVAIAKELTSLREKYITKLSGSHNFGAKFKELKKELKGHKNDYTNDALDILEKEAKQMAVRYEASVVNTKTKDVEAAIEAIEADTEISPEDKGVILAELRADREIAQRLQNATTKSEMRKILKNLNVSNDNFLEDAYERTTSNDRTKTIKMDMEVNARENNVYKTTSGKTNVSAEELQQDIKRAINGVTSWKAFKQYSGITGITKDSTHDAEKLVLKLGRNDAYINQDGTYNLENIAKDVINDIGLDYVLSRNDVDPNSSEIENLKAHMNDRMGLSGKDGLTTAEARALVKLIGAKIEHKDFAKAIGIGAITGAASALAGLLGGLVARHGALEVTQMVNIEINDKTMAETLKKQLSDSGVQYNTTDLTAGKVLITVFQQVIKPDSQKVNTLFGLINGLPIGAAAGILTGIIAGADKAEKTCLSPSDYDFKDNRYTDANRYKEYIAERYASSPMKVEAVKALVDKYVEQYGDDWHTEFQNDMRVAAGLGSTMNPEECRKFFAQKKWDKHERKEDEIEVCIAGENGADAVAPTPTEVKVDTTKGVAWANLAAQYDCLSQYVPNQNTRIRMMKVMQAVNNNNYTLENLKKLTEISLKAGTKDANIRAAFAGVEGFDVEEYIKVLHAQAIGEQKIPQIIINETTVCERDPNIKGNFKVTRYGKANYRSGHAGDTQLRGGSAARDGNATMTVTNSRTGEVIERRHFNGRDAMQQASAARDSYLKQNPKAKNCN